MNQDRRPYPQTSGLRITARVVIMMSRIGVEVCTNKEKGCLYVFSADAKRVPYMLKAVVA
jgi:hypothetical protein